jgi:hypothetical protein
MGYDRFEGIRVYTYIKHPIEGNVWVDPQYSLTVRIFNGNRPNCCSKCCEKGESKEILHLEKKVRQDGGNYGREATGRDTAPQDLLRKSTWCLTGNLTNGMREHYTTNTGMRVDARRVYAGSVYSSTVVSNLLD